MSKTRSKLDETKYFFSQTKEKFNQSRHDEFKYNLNAFLSSARSVTFVMQKEFSKFPEFREWYSKKIGQEFSDENLKKFITLRNISLKEKSINPMYLQEIRLGDGITAGPGGSIEIETNGINVAVKIDQTNASEDEKKENMEQLKKARIRLFCEFQEMRGINLFDISEKYISVLEKITTECEHKFPKTSDSYD